MKKGLLIALYVLITTALCVAQQPSSDVSPAPKNASSHFDFAPGVGFEVDFSRSCTNFSFPIELRLFSVGNKFNFALGERITLHRGNVDTNSYFVQEYYSFLQDPYLTYDQYSTYLTARWNLLPFSDTSFVGIFVGVGYMGSINTSGKVYIDAPMQGPWERAEEEVYTPICGAGLKAYRCDGLFKRLSHSLRLEIGFTTPGFEVSMFGLMALTSPVDLTVASTEMYYDRNHENDQLSKHPVVLEGDNKTSYLPITLTDHLLLYNDVKGTVTLGFSAKVYLGTGYFKSLFTKKH